MNSLEDFIVFDKAFPEFETFPIANYPRKNLSTRTVLQRILNVIDQILRWKISWLAGNVWI